MECKNWVQLWALLKQTARWHSRFLLWAFLIVPWHATQKWAVLVLWARVLSLEDWSSFCPSPTIALFPTLYSKDTDILVSEPIRLIPALKLGHRLFLEPGNALLLMKASLQHLSFSLSVLSSKRPSWSSHWSPISYHITLFSYHHFVTFASVICYLVIC